ncbi:MAG: VCBS repeat-containing protein [Candidatus Binatia bacterium]
MWFGLLSSVPAIAINDCNHNLIADAADLQSGTSADCNHNGRPDECDVGAVLSFAPPVTLTAGRNARSVAVADFDGDTHLDLAVANFDSNYGSPAEQLSLLFGKGGRAFAAPVTVASGRGTSYVAAADVDGDGDTDLITTNADFDQGHHVGVLLNDGRGHFAAGSRFDTQGAPIFVAARRLDGDDDLDLVLAYAGYLLVSILRNDGRGVFAASESFRVTYEPADVGVADFDADGDLDLAVPIAASDRGVWFYRNRGNATFDRRGRVELSQLYTPSALTVADLNGDGAPDVAVGDHARDSIAILTNNRDETFRIAKTFLIGPNQHGISRLLSGDLDGDGDVDLVVVHPFGGGISIAQNNGHGVFSPPLTLPTGELPLAGTVADLDGDGALDIVVANQTSGTVTLVWNASSAAPAPPVSADCNANRRPDDCEVRARDCNGNGTPDDCDPDADGDGITDLCDICPMANNTTDADRDGVPDCLDGCPYDRDKTDPGACGCGSPEADSDGDGTPTCVDNCPDVPNRDQANQDGDVFGDACDGCRGDAAKVEPRPAGAVCRIPIRTSIRCRTASTDVRSTVPR